MSIKHLKTNTVIVSRMQSTGGYRQAFSTVTSAVGALQPISDQNAGLADGVFGRTFQFFCDGSVDINEGDKLTDTLTGFNYRVKAGGIVRRTFNAIDYLKIICERLEDE